MQAEVKASKASEDEAKKHADVLAMTKKLKKKSLKAQAAQPMEKNSRTLESYLDPASQEEFSAKKVKKSKAST